MPIIFTDKFETKEVVSQETDYLKGDNMMIKLLFSEKGNVEEMKKKVEERKKKRISIKKQILKIDFNTEKDALN